MSTLLQGYRPVLYYPKRTSKEIYQILVTQCEHMKLPFLSALPSVTEINKQFHVIVDAIFGFSFKGTSVRPPFDEVLSTLREVTVPIASVDIPSGGFTILKDPPNMLQYVCTGWDVEKGDVNGFGLSPDLLISLTAPKLCSAQFKGHYHYLGLRMVPKELTDKYKLELPEYPGTDQIVQIK